MGSRPKMRWGVLLTLLALVVAACGGDGEGGGEGTDTTGAEGEDRTVVRFAFAPDPAWDHMDDNG